MHLTGPGAPTRVHGNGGPVLMGQQAQGSMIIGKMNKAAFDEGIAVTGAFITQDGDGAPEGVGAICLLGADGDRMWGIFSLSPEAVDGQPDPLDRWSRRVIEGLAARLNAVALFPFGGPPYQPFQRWAARGEALGGEKCAAVVVAIARGEMPRNTTGGASSQHERSDHRWPAAAADDAPERVAALAPTWWRLDDVARGADP